MSLADKLQEQKDAGKLKIEPRFYVQSTHITL